MNNNKKILNIITILIIALFIPNFSFANSETIDIIGEIPKDINLNINNKDTPFKIAVVNGDVYIPIRAFGYALNSNISWNKENKSTMITKSNTHIDLNKIPYSIPKNKFPKGIVSIHKPIYLNNNKSELLSKNVLNIQNTNYIPIKSILKTSPIEFKLDSKNKKIYAINSNIMNPNSINLPKLTKDDLFRTANIDPLVGVWLGVNSFNDDDYAITYRTVDYMKIIKNNNGNYNIDLFSIVDDPFNTEKNDESMQLIYKNIIFNKADQSIYLDPNKISLVQHSHYDYYDYIYPGDYDLFLENGKLSCYFEEGGYAHYYRPEFVE